MTFSGFPTHTIDFLHDLSANNDKTWFDANRDRYEAFWVEPAKAFVKTAGKALHDIADVSYEPRINGSIWRINRDVRFSKDKTPYKETLDMSFWVGDRKNAVSGFYLRISPDTVGIGAGAHGFDKDRLQAFRRSVSDPRTGGSLVEAITAVEALGYGVKGEHYKRAPAGFDVDDPQRERLLRFSALWTGEDRPHPPELFGPGFIDHAVDQWRLQLPLHEWLVSHLA